MSTVASLIAQGKELAGAGIAWADRVSPIMERAFYDTVMGECTRPFESVALSYTCDIVSGTATYCTPPVDTIEAVYATVADTTKHELGVVHSHDARGGVAYTNPQSGDPTIAIVEGLGALRIYPTPNYNATAGLEISGYGPYLATNYTLTSNCPLNAQDEVAVVRGIAYYLLEYISDPRQATMLPLYRRALSQLEINAHTYTAAHRVRGVASATGVANGLNPLNM